MPGAPQPLRVLGGLLLLRQGVQGQEAVPAGPRPVLRYALPGCRIWAAPAGNQGGHVRPSLRVCPLRHTSDATPGMTRGA